MSELHLPWLELALLCPLVGALWTSRLRDAEQAHRSCIAFALATLLFSVGAWRDFNSLHTLQAHDRWDLISRVFGPEALVIDQLSAPLLVLAALLYLLTALATSRNKARRFSFSWLLVSESILLATFSCREPWGIIALLAAGTLHPLVELRTRGKPVRMYALYMSVFVGLMIVGQWAVDAEGPTRVHSWWAVGPLLIGILIRSGIAPLHSWLTDLFENASFGTALLFVTPMVGAYAAVRLVLPIASDAALRSMGLLSLATAVYAGGMAIVQRDARRFFCYLFLSHSALVLVGLETITPVGLTGALCVWLSVGFALTGFGLTLRSVEARTGRLSLNRFHGLGEHAPTLAGFFLLTGLASVGFPGTFGFVGTELLVEGAVETYPYIGICVVAAAALNGIAVVQAYFRVFAGARHFATIPLNRRRRERFAVLALALLILGGGLFPQPSVGSRYNAAREILNRSQDVPSTTSHQLADDSHPQRQATNRPRVVVYD